MASKPLASKLPAPPSEGGLAFQRLKLLSAPRPTRLWAGVKKILLIYSTDIPIVPQNKIKMDKEGWLTMVYLYSLPKDIT